MAIFLTILILIVGALLALVILVQNPKGGGLAAGFGGVSQVGGVQKTTDFLEKSTWYLGILLFALCLLSAKFSGTASTNIDVNNDADTTVPTQLDETVSPDAALDPLDAASDKEE